MAKPAALARARREVANRAAAGGDSRTLRADILDLLRPAVDFDAYAWLLTDPQTCVGSSALADVPRLPELPRLIRLKYLTDVARWTALGPESVTRLRTATGGDRTRSLLWRELQSDWDVGDVASTVQQDRYGCWGFLDLWRSGSDASFTADEAALLADVADVVTAALRRTVADALVATSTATPTATTPSGPAVLLLSADLQVQGQTPPAQEYLRSIVPTSVGAEPVPSVAYNVAAQLLAREAGVDDHPPWARVHLAGNQLMTVRADRISGLHDSDAGSAYDIAVTIEPASAPERVDLFVRAFGLTPRESELVTTLAGGGDTRELARTLRVSENTVQDHLKSVFAKTSARSRTQLLAWLRGS